MFSFEISFVAWLLAGTLVILIAAAYFYGLRPYLRVASYDAGRDGQGETPEDRMPKATVIVHCQNDDEVLDDVLRQLFAQDYPDFEVVVVLDSNLEYADIVTERYAGVYENLYFTFVQPGSHNLSRRKLANTIGIKAAKGDVIVTTVANIRIASERWLSDLMAPFRDGATDVSLGLSRLDMRELTGPRKWFRQFDDVLGDGLWLGYAIDGHPYRGDGYNLAFRRSVFFDHKGYAKSINLHCGDDDLFISEIARGDNTRVVLSDESIVTTEWGTAANRVWAIRKARYSFTERWLPRAPFIRSAVLSALQWAVPGCAVGLSFAGLPSLYPLIFAALAVLSFWGMEIHHYRRLAHRLGAVRLWWAVVPFWMARPVANFFFDIEYRANKKKNFTWQR